MSTTPRVLLSFVGYRDPHPQGSEDGGPVLSLLETRRFDRVVLFCTGSDYLERARSVQEIVGADDPAVQFSFVNFELSSPVDYEEIYTALRGAAAKVLKGMAHRSPEVSVLLDPGTPQMQTAWFLLVRSGELEATLLQGVPPRFAAGVYKVKEVRLDAGVLPEVRAAAPSAGAAAAGISVPSAGELAPGEAGAAAGDPAARDPAAARESAAADKAPTGEGNGRGAWLNTGGVQIVGHARLLTNVLESAVRVAQYDVSVLVRGETGTGKGLVARLIHAHSARVHSAFLPLNCSAIAAGLAESELFGHAKGAFTGATTSRLGQFRAADGGTIFLDEIGDLPLDLQPKLLRALEEKVVVPVGEDRAVPVDVRVIAATNKNLEDMIKRGEFRRDLYERLNQMTLELPPLHRRPEDIPLLIQKFLDDWNTRYHERKELSPEAIARMQEYSWPGNVRELENAVISMCAAARSYHVGPELLPPAVASETASSAGRGGTGPGGCGTGPGGADGAGAEATPPAPNALGEVRIPEEGVNLRAVLNNAERAFYEQALERSGGNAEQAAALLGISGHAFRKALRERFGREG